MDLGKSQPQVSYMIYLLSSTPLKSLLKIYLFNFPICSSCPSPHPHPSISKTTIPKPQGFMATKLVRPSIADSHVNPLIFRTMTITKLQGHVAAGIRSRINTRLVESPFGFRPITITRVAEQSSGLLGDETLSQKKSALYQAVEGINRGIFGIPSAKKSEIEGLVKQLESQNPTPDPTVKLEKVAGSWRLVYSTISILGSKRTKLGLRDFISLDEFFQTIDVAKRVDINFENSTITPNQLMNVFRKHYDILLGIFNPEGWLEITYVDESMRIGRDDKGNIFVLERFEDNNS